MSVLLLFVILTVPFVCGLPRPDESINPLDVSVPVKGNGKCHIENGITLKTGQWRAVENCTMNCTCRKIEDGELLECNDWCKVERRVCREGDILSQTKYFELVGDTGCKRCKTLVCDALLPRNYNSSAKEISTVHVNKTHHIDGKFEIFEEVVVVFKKPKKAANDST